MEMKVIKRKTDDRSPVKVFYVVDGVRVSRDKFETLELKTYMFGRFSCLWNKRIDLGTLGGYKEISCKTADI
jgi:hypothetical protein